MIKAIDTEYKGYNFRSRLEARWAVFFDELGIQWEYKKKGYILEDGTKYLPDFYFPELDWFGEVKFHEFTDSEINKCRTLSKNCLMLCGMPDCKDYYALTYLPVGFEHQTGDEFVPIDLSNTALLWSFKKKEYGGRSWHIDPYFDYRHSSWEVWDSHYLNAIKAARSARFEHGQSGSTL